jgi:hypothetical protein
MKTKLPIYAWGHAILHVVSLVWIRPTRIFPLGFPLQGFNEAVLKHMKAHKNIVLVFLHHRFFPTGFSLARF